MACKVIGWSDPKLTVDEERHREYSIRALIQGAKTDGPASALTATGMPVEGSTWAFKSEVDIYAVRRPETSLSAVVTDEPGRFWTADLKYSTKPLKRCTTSQFENPLTEPMEVSGSFTKFTEEVTQDRFGQRIYTSSFEVIRGPQVEFDKTRPQVKIKQNVLDLELPLLASLIHTLNDSTLWGLDPRMVKLTQVSWSKKWYGTCLPYYTRELEFDINYDTWDREVLDEGTKCIAGQWDSEGKWQLVAIGKDPVSGDDIMPDVTNPLHFKRFQDRNGNTARVLLLAGYPWDPELVPEPGTIPIEYYPEGDLTILGIPTTL